MSVVVVVLLGALLLTPTFAVAEGNVSFVKLVDEATARPGGGNLRLDRPNPILSLWEGHLAFRAFGPFAMGTPQGIYLLSPSGALTVVADDRTAVPGGVGTFAAVAMPRLHGESIAFRGQDAGSNSAIYLQGVAGIERLVAESDLRPDGGGPYEGLGVSGIWGDRVLFRSSRASDGREGIYIVSAGGVVMTVADGDSLAPGLGEPFTGFRGSEIWGTRVVASAFVGEEFPRKVGIYEFSGGVGSVVADQATPVPGEAGRTFSDFSSRVALWHDSILFSALFLDSASRPRRGIFRSSEEGLVAVALDGTATEDGTATTSTFEDLIIVGGAVCYVARDSRNRKLLMLDEGSARPREILVTGQDFDDGVLNDFRPAFDGRHLVVWAITSAGTSGLYAADLGFVAEVPVQGPLGMAVLIATLIVLALRWLSL